MLCHQFFIYVPSSSPPSILTPFLHSTGDGARTLLGALELLLLRNQSSL